ncbi:MAG: tRNA uridine-5-carboxymethylaminomethyl(34) synthesis GTPase MnmE [Candidatus Enteromonas sp.]|nr:tRNA uridine-5-carboxymethylaminomethyl(34) synthesis GTPase MnmE [Candidatus Enteromonas sp.]
MINEPIIALATPPLKSALAVIRLTGEGVFELTDTLFSKKVSGVNSRSVLVGNLSIEGRLIDEVVLLVYPGPNSMTGEDVVEICCHGSMVIVNEIIEAYLSKGVRYATAGEFSSRAFYHGKMDLIEAEAVNDLINATTKEAKNVALLSLSGKTSELVGPLREEISSLLALVEVGIDFPEYDEEETATGEVIVESCKKIRARLERLIAEGEQGKVYQDGVRVAIVGEPNVGKSSILNALLEQDKAIVSSIPGTTRDVVEGQISIHGVPVFLWDTAGIRSSDDELEQLGVERTKKSIEEADLVLFVTVNGAPSNQKERELLQSVSGKPVLRVYNKSDLNDAPASDGVTISAKEKDVEALKEAMFELLGISPSACQIPSLNNARELAILRQIEEDIAFVERSAAEGEAIDLLSVYLQSAYNKTRELLGEDITHDLTDEIFSRFCVGK